MLEQLPILGTNLLQVIVRSDGRFARITKSNCQVFDAVKPGIAQIIKFQDAFYPRLVKKDISLRYGGWNPQIEELLVLDNLGFLHKSYYEYPENVEQKLDETCEKWVELMPIGGSSLQESFALLNDTVKLD